MERLYSFTVSTLPALSGGQHGRDAPGSFHGCRLFEWCAGRSHSGPWRAGPRWPATPHARGKVQVFFSPNNSSLSIGDDVKVCNMWGVLSILTTFPPTRGRGMLPRGGAPRGGAPRGGPGRGGAGRGAPVGRGGPPPAPSNRGGAAGRSRPPAASQRMTPAPALAHQQHQPSESYEEYVSHGVVCASGSQINVLI